MSYVKTAGYLRSLQYKITDRLMDKTDHLGNVVCDEWGDPVRIPNTNPTIKVMTGLYARNSEGDMRQVEDIEMDYKTWLSITGIIVYVDLDKRGVITVNLDPDEFTRIAVEVMDLLGIDILGTMKTRLAKNKIEQNPNLVRTRIERHESRHGRDANRQVPLMVRRGSTKRSRLLRKLD